MGILLIHIVLVSSLTETVACERSKNIRILIKLRFFFKKPLGISSYEYVKQGRSFSKSYTGHARPGCCLTKNTRNKKEYNSMSMFTVLTGEQNNVFSGKVEYGVPGFTKHDLLLFSMPH